MTKRRKARELCLKILYQWDIKNDNTCNGDIEFLINDFLKGIIAPDDVKSFAIRLAKGTYKYMHEIDSLIKRFSEHWTLGRINLIDRNILRSAIYEMLYESEIPSNVTINEAIEVAKKYGTEESGQFVNGILDRIKNELECNKKKNVKN